MKETLVHPIVYHFTILCFVFLFGIRSVSAQEVTKETIKNLPTGEREIAESQGRTSEANPENRESEIPVADQKIPRPAKKARPRKNLVKRAGIGSNLDVDTFDFELQGTVKVDWLLKVVIVELFGVPRVEKFTQFDNSIAWEWGEIFFLANGNVYYSDWILNEFFQAEIFPRSNR